MLHRSLEGWDCCYFLVKFKNRLQETIIYIPSNSKVRKSSIDSKVTARGICDSSQECKHHFHFLQRDSKGILFIYPSSKVTVCGGENGKD